MDNKVTNVTLKIETESGNAAAVEDPRGSVIATLKEIIKDLESGTDDALIFDLNGNSIGEWSLDIEEEIDYATVTPDDYAYNGEIEARYGSSDDTAPVFYVTDSDGVTWYAVKGSLTVNATYDDLNDYDFEGGSVCDVSDHHCFTNGTTIEDLEDLAVAVADEVF